MSLVEIATLAEVKAYLRRATSGDDAILQTLIDGAVPQFENFTARKLMERIYSATSSVASCTSSGTALSTIVTDGFKDVVEGMGVAVTSGGGAYPGGTTVLTKTDNKNLVTSAAPDTALDGDDVCQFTGADEAHVVMDGTGSHWLELDEYPVAHFAGASLIESDGTERVLDTTNHRVNDFGRVWMPNDYFPRGFQNIKLALKSGIPSGSRQHKGLQKAFLRFMQVAFSDQQDGIGRGSSVGAGGESIQLINDPICKDIRFELFAYMRKV